MNICEHPFKSANFLTTNYVMHRWSYIVIGGTTNFLYDMIWYDK